MKPLPDKWCRRWSCLAGMLMLAVGSASAQTPARLEMHLVSGQPGLFVTGEDSSAHTILFTSEFSNPNSWQVLTNIQLASGGVWVVDSSATNSLQRFYRAVASPTNMAFIPAGSFVMGDTLNDYPGHFEQPTHPVYVSGFYMDRSKVTKAQWDEVYNWALTHGYSFDNPGSWADGVDWSKGPDHPVHLINWYDAVKWCNARSEKEGRTPAYYTGAGQTVVYRTGQTNVDNSWVKWNAGYRLPTEAEWEKAARGGASGRRYPWGDTVSHAQANYYSTTNYPYDISPTRGYHPAYDDGVSPPPHTNPVGAFEANGYGLYDMMGNVSDWCWDWRDAYSSGSQTDPRGPTSGTFRVERGGGWEARTPHFRMGSRGNSFPTSRSILEGFRSVLPLGQP